MMLKHALYSLSLKSRRTPMHRVELEETIVTKRRMTHVLVAEAKECNAHNND